MMAFRKHMSNGKCDPKSELTLATEKDIFHKPGYRIKKHGNLCEHWIFKSV